MVKTMRHLVSLPVLKSLIARFVPSLFFALLIFSALYNYAHASVTYERAPSGSEVNDPFSITVEADDFEIDFDADPSANYWGLFIKNLGETYQETIPCADFVPRSDLSETFSVSLPVDDYILVSVITFDTLVDCLDPGSSLGGIDLEYNADEIIFSVVASSGGGVDLGTMIDNANIAFSSTTGFNIPNVVSWGGDNLVKLFIGSIVAIVYHMRYWIIALIIIGAIIYFSYRAFRFFKH